MAKEKAEESEIADLKEEIKELQKCVEEIKELKRRLDTQKHIIQEQYALRYRGDKIGDILGDISLKDLLEIIMHQRHNIVFKHYPANGDYGYLIDLDLDSSPYVCPDGALHLEFRYSPDNYET
tara:strand:+ start:6960 stop:7328 length:369 start_codon:yes stop_codon:yes gene_type:complete